MASRENQGLQIALILFVMITVALAVTTYMYYRKADEKIDEAAAAQVAKAAAETEKNKALFQVQALKYMIGYGEVDLDNLPLGDDKEMQDIINNYYVDMDMFAAGETVRNYRILPAKMETAIRERTTSFADAEGRSAKEIKQRETDVANANMRADKSEAEKQTMSKDHSTAVASFKQYQDQAKQQYNDLLGAQQQATVKFDTAQRKLQGEIGTLAKSNKRLEGLLDDKQKKIDELDGDDNFDGPDGRITWVNQRTGLVWINLGMADGLRRQTSFSVYDRDAVGVMDVENKGGIEITKVLDQHLAEARITSTIASDPILPGDLIHSPAFRPGRKVSFAIAGFIDIDDDGTSDRNLLRNLITLNGGVIDAEAHEDGQITGALKPTTRYLLKGRQPDDKSGPAARQSFTIISREADDLGIENMTVDKFLAFVGWKGEVKTIKLGRFADPADFRPRAPGGVPSKGTGQTAEIFRRRGAYAKPPKDKK